MAAGEASDFFRKERGASEIKAEVWGSYFEAWCGATLFSQKPTPVSPALYLDLNVGQSQDDMEQAAIPVRVLHSIYKSSGSRADLNKSVQTFFGDANTTLLEKLKEDIEQLPYLNELAHQPVVLEEEGHREQLSGLLDGGSSALAYLNPFSHTFFQELLLRSLSKWSCDLFMLFRLDEIQAAVKNSKTDNLLQEIFGERLSRINGFYKQNRKADKREEFLLDCFEDIFRDKGFETIRFRVNLPDRQQTSHYLVFASKTDMAYIRMKELLVNYSDFQEDGVPLFGANLRHQQMSLFHEHYAYSLEQLVKELSQLGHLYNNLTLQQIYERHNVGTHYIIENYKVAYERLMRLGKVRFINPRTGQAIHKITYTSLVRYK